jgi:hypothetical protein
MTYTIILGKSKQSKVQVHLDHPNPSGIPASVLAGVGDKKTRYKNYLSKCFDGGNKTHPRLLNFLAYIHRNGKEHGSINLVANAGGNKKLATMQMEAVKEFIEENRDTLDVLLPYLFADIGLNQSTDKINITNIPDELKNQLDRQLLDQDIVHDDTEPSIPPQLTADDMAQIQKLIEEDQKLRNIETVSFTEQPITEGQ